MGAPVTLTCEAAEQDGTLTITFDEKPIDAQRPLAPGDRRAAEQRLLILGALIEAADHPTDLLASVAEADDTDAARDRIVELLGVSDAGETAVLDLQVRRFSRVETARLRAERDQLSAAIERPFP